MSKQPYLHLRVDSEGVWLRGAATYTHGAPSQRNDMPYLAWLWDGEALTVRNDAFGLIPVYYSTGRDGICVSTSILTLIECGAPADLDSAALSVFIRLGFFVADDTPFAGIKALPANSTLRWRPGRGTSVSGGPELYTGAGCTDEQWASQEYERRFRRAVERRCDERPIVLPLSGGQDSRHILFELIRAGYPPAKCLTTFNYEDRNDVAPAQALAAEFGLSHEVVPPLRDRVGAETWKNEITGFCADDHGWLAGLVQALPEGSVVFDGIAGDVLSAGLFLRPDHMAIAGSGRMEELASVLLNSWSGGERVTEKMFSADAVSRWSFQSACTRLADVLSRYERCVNPLSSFYFWNRTQREIVLYTSCLLRTRGTQVQCPYFDAEVAELLSTLSPGLVADKSFHGKVIQSAFPEHSHIPFAAKGPGRGGLYRRRWAVQLMKSLIGQSVPRASFVLPRLALAALRGTDSLWWHPQRLLCVTQLHEYVSRRPDSTMNDPWVPQELALAAPARIAITALQNA